MATTLSHDLDYDASVEEVAAMLLTPAFREAVCDAQHALRRTVAVDGRYVTVDLVHAARGVPPVAQKLVGDEINIVQEEDWHSPTSARITVTIPGKPGDMRGTSTLTPRDGGTRQQVDLEIKVGLPLVGGKIESMIAGLLTKALDRENEVGRTWLADRRQP